MPGISIVTTTLNAMPYIMETTRSVLQADCVDLEYFLIDAGSTDGTQEYLRGIADMRVRFHVKEGMRAYEAIHWGFREASGDVLAWINGDDIYYPWTLSLVSKLFAAFPQVQWLMGRPSMIDSNGHCTHVRRPACYPREYIQQGLFNEFCFGYLQQESMFWRRDTYENAGRLNLAYAQAADFDLWTRMARTAALTSLDVPLAAFRRHCRNRSTVGRTTYLDEVRDVSRALPRPSWLKRKLLEKGGLLRLLVLASEWHQTPCLSFSVVDSCWCLQKTLKRI